VSTFVIYNNSACCVLVIGMLSTYEDSCLRFGAFGLGLRLWLAHLDLTTMDSNLAVTRLFINFDQTE